MQADKDIFNEAVGELERRLVDLSHLKSALSILSWDQEVLMPPKAAGNRAATLSYLAGELHEKFLSPAFRDALLRAQEAVAVGLVSARQRAIVREVTREFERENKMPLSFVKELAQTTARAHHVWVEARKKSDFQLFLPSLSAIVALKKQEADLVGFSDSPYDALLETYEPYTRTKNVADILKNLKDFLVPFLQKIQASRVSIDPHLLRGNFDIGAQDRFGKSIAEKIGFDFTGGRLDVSPHPFTSGHHPFDVRMTTRFDGHDLFYSLSSVLHETGHALYEQGLPAEDFGTPLGESVSLGIHESQSRVWENMIGHGRPFWKHFYPLLQREFPAPFSRIPFDDFYRTINIVRPSLIRTEADEVTYNLHIILRFEIERDLIEGRLAVQDLPDAWNSKMKELFDIQVPDAARGVLQDVHWSEGMIGYFPAYALGNIYAAQLYAGARKVISDLDDRIEQGDFKEFGIWMKEMIHAHGKFFTPAELIKNASGDEVNASYFTDYLQEKYSEIYDL